MHILSHASILALLAHGLSAVTIRLYREDAGCDANSWLECGDVGVGACCSDGERYVSASYHDLPAEGTPAQVRTQ